jgi:hypothetical protein
VTEFFQVFNWSRATPRSAGPWPIKNLKKQGHKNFFTLTEGVISGLEKPQLDRDGQYTMPDKFFFTAPPVLLFDLAVYFSILLFTFIPPYKYPLISNCIIQNQPLALPPFQNTSNYCYLHYDPPYLSSNFKLYIQ